MSAGAGAPLRLQLRRLHPELGGRLPWPTRQSAGAAGFDVVAALAAGEAIVLPPGGRALVPCGFALAVPAGCEVQLRPRSGLAARHGVTLLNAPGTIDADFRGELKVLLVNHGDAPYAVAAGSRIAQMVVVALPAVTVDIVAELDETARGAGGFGSTGNF